MQTRLALDLGGTKLLVGEVDECGRVLRHQAYPSRGLDQAAALALMQSALEDYPRTVGWVGPRPGAAGVALIGQVDPEQGIWRMIDPAHRQPLPLAQQLRAATGLPFGLENDVKAVALAEARSGAGRTPAEVVRYV